MPQTNREPKRRRSEASKNLDRLEAEAMKDKWHFAEQQLAPGISLAVGARYEYHLRFSTLTGELDVPYLSDSQALALLGAADDGHLYESIRGLREQRAHGEPAGMHAPRVSEEARDAVAAYQP